MFRIRSISFSEILTSYLHLTYSLMRLHPPSGGLWNPPPLPLVLIIRPPSLMIYAAMYLYYNTHIFLEGRGTIVLIFHTFRQLITQHETMFSSRQTAPTSCLSPLCNQFRTTRMHWLITTPGDNESNFCRT